MGTVTYSGKDYTVYGPAAAGATLTEAKEHLQVSIGPGPTAWNALATDELKSKYIVEAFRLLERQKWDSGTAADFDTRNAIEAVLEGGPLLFAHAQYELAALLAANAAIKTDANTGSNVKRVEAKGVSVEFFRATDAKMLSTKLPASIMDLVGQYLAASVSGSAAAAYNTRSGSFDECVESSFDDCASHDMDGPF